MKPKILIGFVGMLRSFKTTKSNIFANLINNNKDTFDIDVVFNTDYYNCSSTRHGANPEIINPKYDNELALEKEIKNVYGDYVKGVQIFNINTKEMTHTWIYFYIRAITILRTFNNYDYVVILRPDIVLTNPINLENLVNNKKLMLVECLPIRPHPLHNRDFMDIALLGEYKTLYFWLNNVINILYFTLKDCKIGHYHPIKSHRYPYLQNPHKLLSYIDDYQICLKNHIYLNKINNTDMKVLYQTNGLQLFKGNSKVTSHKITKKQLKNCKIFNKQKKIIDELIANYICVLIDYMRCQYNFDISSNYDIFAVIRH